MKKILLAAFGISFCVLGFAATVAERASTEDEIRARQALGRALISPDGKFFVYEWMRPYNWVRDTGSIPAGAAGRMQTWLYRVDVSHSPANSEYVFFPDPGASYWLGAFSPDGSKLSFYELDNDNNVVKAGVAAFTDPITPKLTWFEPTPDARKLERPAVWLSNDELVYPAAGGRLIANADSGETRPCNDCDRQLAQVADQSRGKIRQPGKVPANLRVLARSADGDLTVYEKSDSKVLGLVFSKGSGEPETVVFENERRLAAWSPPHWPDRKD
jgi:hypothetical protein